VRGRPQLRRNEKLVVPVVHSFEPEVVESMLQKKPSRTRGNSQEIETGYVVGADIGGTSLRLALAGMTPMWSWA
jgi:hypothetical protein